MADRETMEKMVRDLGHKIIADVQVLERAIAENPESPDALHFRSAVMSARAGLANAYATLATQSAVSAVADPAELMAKAMAEGVTAFERG